MTEHLHRLEAQRIYVNERFWTDGAPRSVNRVLSWRYRRRKAKGRLSEAQAVRALAVKAALTDTGEHALPTRVFAGEPPVRVPRRLRWLHRKA